MFFEHLHQPHSRVLFLNITLVKYVCLFIARTFLVLCYLCICVRVFKTKDRVKNISSVGVRLLLCSAIKSCEVRGTSKTQMDYHNPLRNIDLIFLNNSILCVVVRQNQNVVLYGFLVNIIMFLILTINQIKPLLTELNLHLSCNLWLPPRFFFSFQASVVRSHLSM